MTNLEGKIDIILRQNEKGIQTIEIKSNRPVHACQVLIGKTPKQALNIIPLIFSVCGTAQSCAATRAIQGDLGIIAESRIETARDILVLVEVAKEHLLRINIDWPKLFIIHQNLTQLPFVAQLVNQFKEALFENSQAFFLNSKINTKYKTSTSLIDDLEDYLVKQVFGCSLAKWNHFSDINQLEQWANTTNSVAAKAVNKMLQNNWHNMGQSTLKTLPELDTDLLIEQFDGKKADQFVTLPRWLGSSYETSSLSRNQDHPLISNLIKQYDVSLIARLTARLLEIAKIPSQLRVFIHQMDTQTSKKGCSESIGLAQVEAARGRLIHRVKIKNDIIQSYRILAPTEWNFNEEGPIKQSLNHIQNQAKELQEQLARILISSIDPCVDYNLRIENA